jgi:hypothetical protein
MHGCQFFLPNSKNLFPSFVSVMVTFPNSYGVTSYRDPSIRAVKFLNLSLCDQIIKGRTSYVGLSVIKTENPYETVLALTYVSATRSAILRAAFASKPFRTILADTKLHYNLRFKGFKTLTISCFY